MGPQLILQELSKLGDLQNPSPKTMSLGLNSASHTDGRDHLGQKSPVAETRFQRGTQRLTEKGLEKALGPSQQEARSANT